MVLMVRRHFFWTMAGVAAILRAGEPWTEAEVRQPGDLAKDLKDGKKPLVLYVGFAVLYKASHIPGAVFAGPGSKPTGIEAMEQALSGVPKDREIALYCGCCPFDHCPNIRPAFEKIKALGYTNAHLIMMPTNFHTDWVEHGYPVEKPA
jgi:thiosulfate/3-mercaptopyruvate sulfurtransferase